MAGPEQAEGGRRVGGEPEDTQLAQPPAVC